MSELVKVRLLNNGGFGTKKGAKFPVVVNGEKKCGGKGVVILHKEIKHLISAGGVDDDYGWNFFIGLECEIIND